MSVWLFCLVFAWLYMTLGCQNWSLLNHHFRTSKLKEGKKWKIKIQTCSDFNLQQNQGLYKGIGHSSLREIGRVLGVGVERLIE